MVESGHEAIRAVEFASQRHPDLPVEVLVRSDLLARVDRAHFEAPQRADFHSLILMRSAGGSHRVDFEDVEAKPARLVQVRPGQLAKWDLDGRYDATAVIARSFVADTSSWFPGHRAWCDLGADDHTTASALIEVLQNQQDRFDGDEATRRILTATFSALVALFERSQQLGDVHLPPAYVAFRTSIEANLTMHDVTDHARAVGWSARTISRACQEVSGRTAKQVLSDRVVLEAKRLLTHTDLTAAAIGHRLGFSEPTNFTKFFVRWSGTSPSSFRTALG